MLVFGCVGSGLMATRGGIGAVPDGGRDELRGVGVMGTRGVGAAEHLRLFVWIPRQELFARRVENGGFHRMLHVKDYMYRRLFK